SGNPGPGGWGVVVNFNDGSIYEMGGSAAQTTNNRMELQAAIAALKLLAASGQSEAVSLYTDSEYVKKGITQWISSWKTKGWKTSQGKPVQNQDLWETLDRLNSQQVQWCYVQGHSNDVCNDRCDAIARAFAGGQTPSLRQAASVDSFQSNSIHPTGNKTIQSSSVPLDAAMTDSIATPTAEFLDNPPREVRVAQLRNLMETLQMAEEVASKGYLITSSELADLMDVNASAVTSRGDNWVWRNWVVSRVRREGNQILWQLERVD
ncbi:MAG: ribonuclease HI, partial [Desertifilum sp. SIO1I2]|nr:ribonuclease HI [Desertifilum sp. SIO1I2]